MTTDQVISRDDGWPFLALAEWKDTCDTLHMWTQVVGKVRLELSPHINHWWEVPLYVSARGLTTSPIPCPKGIFEIEFDFIEHTLHIVTSWNETKKLRLHTRSVADFYADFMGQLKALGIGVKIWPMPVEVPDPIQFDKDETHSRYDPGHAHRFWRLLVTLDAIFKEFRARFLGKVSPVHFFWGSFDLACTRFSGRRAPERPGADKITKDAYSHEEISAGWWPGGGAVTEAAFYAYAAPEPAGFREAGVLPEKAFYHAGLGEYILPYEDVRASTDPRAALLAFLESTYDAGSKLGNWDRNALDKA
jgi:Family of unknown function (DUF5996)